MLSPERDQQQRQNRREGHQDGRRQNQESRTRPLEGTPLFQKRRGIKIRLDGGGNDGGHPRFPLHDLPTQSGQGWTGRFDNRLGIHPQPDSHGNQGPHHHHLASSQIGKRAFLLVRSVEDRLNNPERIDRRGDETPAGQNRPQPGNLPRAQQGQELRHKVAEPRQAQRSPGKDQRHSPHSGGNRPQAPHLGKIACVNPFLKGPRQNEQSARRQTVAQHLHHHALQRQFVPREHAEHHKSHVADAGIGDQPFEILLRKRQNGAVNNSDHPERHGERRHPNSRFREKGDNKAQHPVGARLEKETGQDDTPRRRGLGVRVRQPGMKRKDRQFDGERDPKTQH